MPALPSGLIGGALALGLVAWWFGGVLDAKDEAFGADGDWPNVPGELAASNKPGGGGAGADRQNGSLAHTQTSPSIAPTERGSE